MSAPTPPEGPVREGHIAFMRHCNGCHPGGGAGLGPAVGAMPAYKGSRPVASSILDDERDAAEHETFGGSDPKDPGPDEAVTRAQA